MEGLNFKNNNEAINSAKISLNNKIFQNRMAGRPIAAGVQELIKIFAIADKIANSEINSEVDAGKLILDLWEELDVHIFEPEDIFTKNNIIQLMNATNVENIFGEINNGPILIEKAATVDSVMDKWKKVLQANIGITNTNEKEKVTKQKEADEMYAALETLDFNKVEIILEWLNNYNGIISDYNLDNHIEAIKSKFAQNGHYPEDNDSFNFAIGEAIKDKNRYKQALIGYMLDNLGVFDSNQMSQWISDLEKNLV